MSPNQITVFRVFVALASIFMFRFNFWASVWAVLLTAVAILLDGVDGYVARRSGRSTSFGAALDILGDRIVEDAYLVFFAAAGLISFWIPVVFILRGAVTDFLRAAAHAQRRESLVGGRLFRWWSAQLVRSRWSRAAYGTLKAVTFCYLGSILLLQRAGEAGIRLDLFTINIANDLALILTYSILAFCLIRGMPVLWEARSLLEQT